MSVGRKMKSGLRKKSERTSVHTAPARPPSRPPIAAPPPIIGRRSSTGQTISRTARLREEIAEKDQSGDRRIDQARPLQKRAAGRIHPVLDEVEPPLPRQEIANLHEPQKTVRILVLEEGRIERAGRDDRDGESRPEDQDQHEERWLGRGLRGRSGLRQNLGGNAHGSKRIGRARRGARLGPER